MAPDFWALFKALLWEHIGKYVPSGATQKTG